MTSEPSGPSIPELVRRIARGEAEPPPIALTLGFTMTELGEGTSRFEMDALPERHANPMGTLQGGVLCSLADAAMGMAFAATLEDGESFATVELGIHYFKPIWRARLTAVGRVVKRGRDVGYAECDVTGPDDGLIARASCTCLVLRGDRATGR